jgi:hypothetical protein
MIQRCEDAASEHFKDYGGRGIRVCKRWRESFEAFLEDMGPKPLGGSIERKEVNGHYEPGNCEWIPQRRQTRNQRSNKRITLDGQTRCVAEWAELYGINPFLVYRRLRRGWDSQRALTTPSLKKP